MAKNNGTGTAIYVLTGDWNKLIKHEGFKAKTEVQLWAYRVNGELCFALVNLGKPNPNPNPYGDSSSSSSSITKLLIFVMTCMDIRRGKRQAHG